jgi:hypothetical protein
MIRVNLSKAKGIAHDKRRAARAKEFEPLDEVIAKQIPGKSATEAEASRQVIRDKYAVAQTNIDAATSVEELKAVLATFPQDLPRNGNAPLRNN